MEASDLLFGLLVQQERAYPMPQMRNKRNQEGAVKPKFMTYPDFIPPQNWPKKGKIQFKKVLSVAGLVVSIIAAVIFILFVGILIGISVKNSSLTGSIKIGLNEYGKDIKPVIQSPREIQEQETIGKNQSPEGTIEREQSRERLKEKYNGSKQSLIDSQSVIDSRISKEGKEQGEGNSIEVNRSRVKWFVEAVNSEVINGIVTRIIEVSSNKAVSKWIEREENILDMLVSKWVERGIFRTFPHPSPISESNPQSLMIHSLDSTWLKFDKIMGMFYRGLTLGIQSIPGNKGNGEGGPSEIVVVPVGI